MTKKLIALNQSIEHWENMIGGKESTVASGASCALCQAFDTSSCSGCPVRDRTKNSDCMGSPWESLFAHCNNVHKVYMTTVGFFLDCPDCVKLAKKELRFLKSLLPKIKKVQKEK